MSINLHTKYEKKLVDAYTFKSFLAGRAKGEFDFTGNRTIHLSNIITQALNDYDKTSTTDRYGGMKELQDTYQELTLSQDKAFKIAIDQANNKDQNDMKEAGRVMQAEIDEQFVPTCDKRSLSQWAAFAGQTVAIGNATITGNLLIQALVDIETGFENTAVPVSDRYVALKNSMIAKLRMADRWQYCDNQTEKYLEKGQVTNFGTLKIFGMPDAWFPTNVEGLAFQSKAVLSPMKIKDCRIKDDSEFINGALLLGRFYYDAFVVGRRCDGVCALVDNGKKTAAPTVTKATNTTLASTTSSAVIYYTTDGSDPRYSATRVTYSAAITNPDAGVVIKAVAQYVAGGYYWSDVTEHTCV